MNIYRLGLRALFQSIIILGVFVTVTASAQEINLDQMQRFGDLICYPSLKEPDVFYYLPDRPRLAMKDGRPQFSFIKYARVQETGEAGTGRAEGGGIVHFLVTYGADASRIKGAENALRQTRKNGRIAGPIVYRTGSFALVTSFQEGETLTTRTVAVGKAPLMEGQKAAVSIALTREGAELLWESFQSDTPDISLVFDMEFSGLREPYEATLEADWVQVSKHHRVKAGMKYSWFGADIDLLFQDLRQTGAVKVVTKGESAPMEKILDSVNNRLLQVMFDQSPTDDISRAAAEKDSYSSLNQAVQMLRNAAPAGTGGSGGTSGSGSGAAPRSSRQPTPLPENGLAGAWKGFLGWLFSRAHADTTESSATEDQEIAPAREMINEGISLSEAGRYSEALSFFENAQVLWQQREGSLSGAGVFDFEIAICHLGLGNLDQAARHFQLAVERGPEGARWMAVARENIEDLREQSRSTVAERSTETVEPGPVETVSGEVPSAESASDAYNRARRLDEAARTSGYEASAVRAAVEAYELYQRAHQPTGSRAQEVSGRIRMLRDRLGTAGDASAGTSGDGPVSATTARQLLSPFDDRELDAAIASSSSPATPAATPAPSPTPSGSATPAPSASPSTAAPSTRPAAATPGTAAARRSDGSPGFSLVASYQMKQVKRSGRMVYHLNHYRTETQAFAMTENIGNLYRRYGNDRRIFRAVNIDDPVFKQREIHITLDGQDADTFSRHMNFVTVQMKKRHQSGELTIDEVVITPDRFNQNGNAFTLIYGWKGDDDRTAWLNYQVETLWSFHGGMQIRMPSANYDSAMLALQPPHRYRSVTVEGEGEALTAAQVRHAVLTFTSYVAGKPITTEVTIRNQGPASSLILALPEDRDGRPTSVSFTWYLRGGKTITAPARELEGDIIYWDELPDKEV